MRVQYVKQRDKYSCGPVAIMNVLKWVGVRFSYEERIELFQDLCCCVPSRGTKHAAFDKALRKTAEVLGGLQIRRVHRPKLWQIEEHLRSGGIVVLNYYWERNDDDSRHFMLLTKISASGKSFLMINDHRAGPAAQQVTREKFKQYNLRFQRPDPHYKAWFVSLKD